jgi:hypothetical protein
MVVTSLPSAWTQDRAALDRDPIEVDGACAAVRGIAPDGRAGLADALPQVMDQQQARFDVVLIADAIDLDGNSCHPSSSCGDGCGSW